MSNSNQDDNFMIEPIELTEEELEAGTASEQYKSLVEMAKGVATVQWDKNGEPVLRVAATIKAQNVVRMIGVCRAQGITPGVWVTEEIRRALMSPTITSYLKATSSHPDP